MPSFAWRTETPDYTEKSISLENGDRIFLYTDGIIEIKNIENVQFGEDRLLNILLNDRSDLDAVLNKIIDSAFQFSGMKDFSEILDDITIALIEVK
jgi:phosphoserine phosphatase RsbU/P